MKDKLILTLLMTFGFLSILGSGVVPTKQEECSSGVAEACTSLAREYGNNYSKSVPILIKGCNLGDSSACVDLARLYRDDEGLPKNIPLAKKYAQLGCKNGSDFACSMRTRPKTPAEQRKDEQQAKQFVSCIRKIDSCKNRCLDGYSTSVTGSSINVAQYHLDRAICIEECNNMKCF